MGELGLQFNQSKCAAIIDGHVTGTATPELDAVGIPVVEALPILGSELHDDVGWTLIHHGAAAVPEATLKRQRKAQDLMAGLRELLNADVELPVRVVVWHVARACIANALAYDAVLVHTTALEPVAAVLDEELFQLAAQVMECSGEEQHKFRTLLQLGIEQGRFWLHGHCAQSTTTIPVRNMANGT